MSKTVNWDREHATCFWEPSKKILASIRSFNRNSSSTVIGRLNRKISVLRHRFWSVVACCDIPIDCSNIDGGLMLLHPVGVVIHPHAKIGPNCTILQNVTIGERNVPGATPTIGANVLIGAGAKILGGVVIGDNARIGANTVVVNDVPAGATVVGARMNIIQR